MVTAVEEQKKTLWRKKLLLRAQRRGLRELDLIIGDFAEAALANMSESELSQFEQIMHVPDQEMLECLFGVAPLDTTAVASLDTTAPVLDRLRAFCALWNEKKKEARV